MILQIKQRIITCDLSYQTELINYYPTRETIDLYCRFGKSMCMSLLSKILEWPWKRPGLDVDDEMLLIYARSLWMRLANWVSLWHE